MARASAGLEIGSVMPDVALPSVDGRVVRLAEFRGRPLLVFMWASW